MNKELESLKEINNILNDEIGCLATDELLNPIEEALKVLEIIKKNVNVHQLIMAIEMNGVLGSELELLKEIML